LAEGKQVGIQADVNGFGTHRGPIIA